MSQCSFVLAYPLQNPPTQTKTNNGGNMRIVKKALLLSLAGILMFTATGCNDKDVATGVIVGGIIGGIVGAGGGVSVGTPTYGYNYLSDCEGYNREWICEWSYSSHTWYRSQRRWYPQFTESAVVQNDLKAAAISQRWGLNSVVANKLSQAIENAKGGDLKAFDKVGLDLPTLGRLLNQNQIDVNDLGRFADALNTSEKTALDILNAFTGEYAVQKKDVNSALWRQCQSTGSWKTPEAASCSSLDAQGCAPATGASNCLSL